MNECFCRVGDIELCYETFGDAADPAMLLVMGLATQMLGWHEDFCEQLTARGFHVIRFDNRDIGRSTRLSGHRPPTTGQLLRRDRQAAAYTLADMAADGIGLLDHLQIRRAHVVGASMGGMIAQEMAIGFPDRVLSLCSIMSNTGSRLSGQPVLALYSTLLRPAPRERQAAIEHAVRVYTEIASPVFARDELELRDVIERSYDRPRPPAGRDRRERQPHRAPPAAPAADAGHPRDARPAGQAVRRARGRARRARRPAAGDRGHGPRSAARGVAQHHRRHRRERRADARAGGGYVSATISTMTSRTNRIAPASAGCH